MTTTTLPDGTEVHCVRRAEARVLDHHVRGYLDHEVQLEEGAVVLDVGANIGLFGVRACQAFPDVEVHAFEPVPAIFEACRLNAERHGPGRFHVHNLGLGATTGQARFTWYPNAPALSTARPEDWDADPHAWRSAVRGQLQALPPELAWARHVPSPLLGLVAWYLRRGAVEVDCPVLTLSEFLETHRLARVDLLKIDCEGFELDVLEGLRAEHWPRVRQVVVEVNDQDGRADRIEALLRDHGFTEIARRHEDAFADTPLVNLYAQRGPHP